MSRTPLALEFDGVDTIPQTNPEYDDVLFQKDPGTPRESRQTLLAEPEYNKGPGLLCDRPIGF